jgi:hypothetical protein
MPTASKSHSQAIRRIRPGVSAREGWEVQVSSETDRPAVNQEAKDVDVSTLVGGQVYLKELLFEMQSRGVRSFKLPYRDG